MSDSRSPHTNPRPNNGSTSNVNTNAVSPNHPRQDGSSPDDFRQADSGRENSRRAGETPHNTDAGAAWVPDSIADTIDQRIILCIPGPWVDEAAFRAALEREAPDFDIGLGVLMETATEALHRYEFRTSDERLREAFASTSGGRIPAAQLDQIAAHRHVVYLIHDSVGPASARAIVQAGEAILDAGGFAVKVETAGVAFSPETWRAIAEADDTVELYSAFVAHAYDSASAYTCGMHNLGLPDAAVEGIGGPDAARLLEIFNLYQYLEQPTLQEGQIFAIAQDAPRYRLHRQPCQTFPADHTYHNPYGIWQLRRAA